jgi:hypothetical protein
MNLSPWDLNVAERRCIGRLCLISETLSSLPGVGMPTINKLIKYGLVETDPPEPNTDVHYKLTEAGEKMHEQLWKMNRIPR